ncbi:hypothetical protein [Rhodovulum sp. ES.010]|uniref:hypothetical protein n=1 Tax=Rhodovulum sp. ES.010 TaxID=1882821 RepID=UPI000941A13B|nr:hypothetical protein [Rhodovulum sp. ES.010]
MLIASYFIANAMGLVVSPEGIVVMPPPETGTVASWAGGVVIWLLGAALFAGRMVRPAAMVIGFHTLGTALWSDAGAFETGLLTGQMWTQLAMTAALAAIALSAHREATGGTRPAPAPMRNQPTRVAEAEAAASRHRLELAAARATLADIQSSDIGLAPTPIRRSA